VGWGIMLVWARGSGLSEIDETRPRQKPSGRGAQKKNEALVLNNKFNVFQQKKQNKTQNLVCLRIVPALFRRPRPPLFATDSTTS